MVFSSILFVFGFFPIVIFIYFLLKEQYRNYFLAAASLLFYAAGGKNAVLLMIFSIITNYFAALGIDRIKRKRYRLSLLVATIIGNLGILYYFKYFNFSISIVNRVLGKEILPRNIVLPLGISFFTFQAMSYVIDVYKHNAVAEKNIFNVALYISFFPQLIAGPIVRYNSIAQQIKCRHVDAEQFGYGAKRFICGFSKKTILANNLAIVAEKALLSGNFYDQSVMMSWLGTICFTLQIYYDFSGYSDMAIGLGRMFGFRFEENFSYPYMSGSVTEFWRKWHISLGQWFRDYVYIPLGGSHVSVFRHILNLLIVWALTGLWHGASYSFVVWGMMYFVCLVLEKYVVKPEKRKGLVFKIAWHILTLIIVSLGWVLFDTESVALSLQCYGGMLGYYKNVFIDEATCGVLRENIVYIVMGILFSFPLAPKLSHYCYQKLSMGNVLDIAVPVGYIMTFLWGVSFLILGAHNPFIYFNF